MHLACETTAVRLSDHALPRASIDAFPGAGLLGECSQLPQPVLSAIPAKAGIQRRLSSVKPPRDPQHIPKRRTIAHRHRLNRETIFREQTIPFGARTKMKTLMKMAAP